jgi:hypothetical protein
MTDAPEEWGPMIEHDGSPCPVVGRFCHVIAASGLQYTGIVHPPTPCSAWFWEHLCFMCYPHRVVQYRIRKPRALLDLIERAKDIDDAPEGPVRIKETEDA